MVFVQNALGFIKVELVLGLLVPRHREQAVEVVADHVGLGGHRRHHLELLQLALAHLLGLFRERQFLQFLGVFLNLGLAVLALSEFLLNRLDLLVEVVLLLGAANLALHALLELALHLLELALLQHALKHHLQPLVGIPDLQQLLLLLEVHVEQRRNPVGKPEGRLGINRQLLDALRVPLDLLQVALELAAHILAERDQFRILLLILKNRLDQPGVVRIAQPGLQELPARFCLKQRLDGAVVEPHDLQHLPNGSH